MSAQDVIQDRAEYIVLIDSDNYDSKVFFIEEVMKLQIGNKELVTQFICSEQNDRKITFILNKDDYYNQFYARISHIIIVISQNQTNDNGCKQIFDSYEGSNKAFLQLHQYDSQQIEAGICKILDSIVPSLTLQLDQSIDRQIQKMIHNN